MYPPKATDEQVRQLIRDLTVNGEAPSGNYLRAVLAERYHSRGGVRRIYRLLAAETADAERTAASALTARLLEQEIRNLRDQLRQARERGEAHQAYWTRQVGDLQRQVEALAGKIEQAGAGQGSEAVHRELQDLEVRAGRLEIGIRTFGPAAGAAQPRK